MGFLSSILLSLTLAAEVPIGTVTIVSDAAAVLYFEGKPGKFGKPKERVGALIMGVTYPLYEIYDWADVDPRLKGHGNHRWIRTGDGWTYCMRNVRIDTNQSSMEMASFLGLSKLFRKPAPGLLISDAEFTDQQWSGIAFVRRFCQQFTNNRFGEAEFHAIVDAARKHNISVLVLLVKLEQEQSLVRNSIVSNYERRLARAMAYSIGIDRKQGKPGRSEGFGKQIEGGAGTLARHFGLWKKGGRIRLGEDQGDVRPVNAATWSLYRYCPYYGEYDNFGYKNIGNKLFETIYADFKKKATGKADAHAE